MGWTSYFYIHHRHTPRLRVGRIFIAGDAAHIHSPFGGQGMNTGLHDVWNLAWKLDLVVHGHGNEELLDSYGAERVPMIKKVIKTTHTMTRVMGTSSKVVQALRNTMLPLISRLPAFQRAFVGRLSGLAIKYRGSTLIDGDGSRYLEDSMRGGEGIRSRFLLLCNENAKPAVKEEAGRLAASLSDVLDLRMGQERDIRLVRPDGYVAYSQRGGDPLAALASARSLLEFQTTVGQMRNISREPEPLVGTGL